MDRNPSIILLLSRMRTAGSNIHPQLVMTANPDRNSFLYEWVKFCLDENGVPKEGTEKKKTLVCCTRISCVLGRRSARPV